MSTVSKGKKHELEVVKIIQMQGYLTYKPQKTSRFGSQDIFGLWDICAISPKMVRFVQVKSGNTQGFLKKLKGFAVEHNLESVVYELWVKQDYQDWVIYSCYKDKLVKIRLNKDGEINVLSSLLLS